MSKELTMSDSAPVFKGLNSETGMAVNVTTTRDELTGETKRTHKVQSINTYIPQFAQGPGEVRQSPLNDYERELSEIGERQISEVGILWALLNGSAIHLPGRHYKGPWGAVQYFLFKVGSLFSRKQRAISYEKGTIEYFIELTRTKGESNLGNTKPHQRHKN